MILFHTWLVERERHHPVVAAPYNVLPVIVRSGVQGITRRELGEVIDLEPHVLNGLLASLAGIGLIAMAVEDGQTVLRSVCAATLHQSAP